MPARAQEALQGEIRFQPGSEDVTWVGQELELYLELWTTGFSFSGQSFVLPEVRGGFVLLPDSSTVKLNEKRDGMQWQGLRYTLLLYPQREGRLEVPSFKVRFSANAGYGTEPSTFESQTPVLFVDTRLPPGADRNGLVVTTRSFSVESSWSPRPEDDGPARLKVGDALTLAVTRRAQDIPGMVFAPLPDFRIEGLGVYPATPGVNDRVNRGSLTGERRDTVTFICEREGKYEIPELRFQWWDPDREELVERIVPALALEVSANPAYAAGASAVAGSGGDGIGWGRVGAGVAAILGLMWLLSYPARRLFRKAAAQWRLRREKREAGEPWAFRQVRKNCVSGSPAQAYHAIIIWLGRFEREKPGLTLLRLADERADERGDEALRVQAERLQSCLATDSAGEWRGRELAELLVQLRNDSKKKLDVADVLHPLNPH